MRCCRHRSLTPQTRRLATALELHFTGVNPREIFWGMPGGFQAMYRVCDTTRAMASLWHFRSILTLVFRAKIPIAWLR